MGMKNIVYLLRNSSKKQMIIFFIISALASKKAFYYIKYPIVSTLCLHFFIWPILEFFVCFLAELLPWKIASEIKKKRFCL